MSKFCKLDLRQATLHTVLKETINKAIVENVQGRYSYKLIDDNYTIEIVPSEKITNNAIAKKVSNYLNRKINSYRPDILKVVPKQIDEYSAIQLEVYVNPAFIEQKFQELPEEKRNNVLVNIERDLDFFNGDQALYEQEEKDIPQYNKSFKQQLVEDSIEQIAKSLKNRTGIDYSIINPEQANELTKNTKHPWNGEGAFFLGDTVYIVGKENFSLENVFHEFAHPFIRAVRKNNPELFNKLYKEHTTDEFVEYISKLYPELAELVEQGNVVGFMEELLVHALTDTTLQQRQEVKSILEKFWLALKQILRKLYPNAKSLSTLDRNTSLNDLAKILLYENVDLNQDVLDSFMNPMFSRKLQEELQKINPNQVNQTINEALSLMIEHTKRIAQNKNLSELKKFFNEEEQNSEIYNTKEGLKRAARLIDMLEKDQDKLRNFGESLENLKIFTEQFAEHANELSKTEIDPAEKISVLRNYIYIANDWKGVLEPFIQKMKVGAYKQVPELNKLLSQILTNIEDVNFFATEYIKNDGLPKLLSEDLKKNKFMEEARKKLFEEIEELKKQKKEGRKTVAGALSIKPIDEAIKEKMELYKKTDPSEETIAKWLTGEMGDANFLSGTFESHTSNPNPIVGGFSNFFMKQIAKMEAKLQERFQKFYNVLSKINVPKNDLRTTFEKITSRVIKGYFNKETGVLEQRQYITLLNQYQGDWDYILSNYKKQLDDILEKNNNVKTQEWYDKKKEEVEFVSKYMFSDKTDAVSEAKQFWLQSLEHIKAQEVRQNALDKLREVQQRRAVTNEELETKQQDLKEAIREYQQLTKLTDEFGNPKEDQTIPIILKEYQQKYGNMYERKEVKGAFDAAFKDEKERLLQIYGEENQEYNTELNKWVKANIKIVLSDKFYEDRQVIIDEIDTILSKSKETKDLRISEIWKQIIDLTKSYRDEDNQPIGTDINKEAVSKIKQNQERIIKLREEFRKMMNFTKEEEDTFIALNNVVTSGQMLSDEDYEIYEELKNRNDILSKNKLTKDELKRLYSLYEKLETLQSRVSTPYYVEIVNTFMDRMGKDHITLSDEITDISEMIKPEERDDDETTKAKKEFEEWFLKNHILENIKVKEDNRFVNKQVYKRLYIWNRILPNEKETKELLENEDYVSLLSTNSKYVKVEPSNNYYYISLKPEFKTKQIVGVTVDNRGQWLPKPTQQSASSEQLQYMKEAKINFAVDNSFVDQKYLQLKQEGGEYWKLLQEYTKLHLEQQKEKPRYTRLWMEVPRRRKTRIEYSPSEIKQGLSDVIERNNPFTKKETEDAFSTGQGNYESDETRLEEYVEDDGVKTLVMTDIFGNQPTNIPIKFTKYIKPELVSMDIAASIVEYGVSLETNKVQHEVNPIFQSLKETLAQTQIKDLNKVAMSFGRKALNKLVNKTNKGENNMYKAIESFMEMHIEGIEKKFEFGVGYDRVANHLMKIGSLTLVAPAAAIKNVIAGNIQKTIEAIGGKNMNAESLAKGEAIFDSRFVPAMVKDTYSLTKSLETQIMQLFDPNITFLEEVGQIANNSVKRDVVDLKFLLGAQKLGEIHIQGSTAVSMLYHLQVPYTNANGEQSYIRYLDAWELKDGVIQLKEGVDKSWDKDSDNFAQYKLRIQKVNELNQGAYSNKNKAAYQMYTNGKLASFMRRFFAPLLMNRWSFQRANYALGDTREGYYQTFMRLSLDFISSTGKNWKYYSEEEKRNAMKVVIEIGYSMMFLAVISLLGWDDDDEDKYKKLEENWVQSYLIYQTMLIKSETETFIPIPGMGWDEAYRLVSTPTVALSTLGKYKKLIQHTGLAIIGDEDAVYDRDYGVYNKGDYKYLADLYSIFGVKNFLLLNEPEQGIKQYMQIQRRN